MSMAERSTSLARRAVYGLLGAVLAIGALAPVPARASAPVQITALQNAGPNTGGITITIQGNGFQSGAQVRIGPDSPTTNFIDSSDLSVVTPNIGSSYGFFPVEVDNPDGGTTTDHFTFNDYEQLPADTPQSAVHVATHDLSSDQQLDAFTRGSDNTLHHTWETQMSPTWAAWESLGGGLTSAPTAVSWGNQNRIDVFVKGTDSALWHKWWDGTRWNGWEPLGGVLTTDPVVTSWGVGRLDVFGKGTDNQLWHKFYAGGWSGWEPLGGVLASGPGGVSWGPNRIDVFVLGTDNQIYHKWWSAAWSGWERHGFASTLGPADDGFGSGPGVASTGVGELDVYALGHTVNTLWHQPFAGSWGGWISEGKYWVGGWQFGPGAVSQSFKVGIDTFEVASDNTIWHTVTEPASPPHARVRGSAAPAPRR
jgi:hypothetical protein